MTWRLGREPLFHFLIGGGLLYAAYFAVSGDKGGADREIIVNRAALLNFLQYRYKAFRPDLFATQLDRMPEAERASLVSDYVDEEMLYREARSYGLEQADDVIRQRLIQKMQFLLDSDETESPPTAAELRTYFDAHADRYVSLPSITFTHIFFDNAIHGADTERLARKAVQQSNRDHIRFAEAPAHGDRFPFLINYVDRPEDVVEGHFGAAFAAAIKSLKPSEKRWQGPYRSSYGWHAVLITGSTPAKQLRFDDVKDEVRDAFIEERKNRLRHQALQSLRKQYQVKLDLQRADSFDAG